MDYLCIVTKNTSCCETGALEKKTNTCGAVVEGTSKEVHIFSHAVVTLLPCSLISKNWARLLEVLSSYTIYRLIIFTTTALRRVHSSRKKSRQKYER
jgi:hypothetical protein